MIRKKETILLSRTRVVRDTGKRTKSPLQGRFEQSLGGSGRATFNPRCLIAGTTRVPHHRPNCRDAEHVYTAIAIARCIACAASLNVLAAFLLFASTLHAYSVLTHEAIIDTAWDHDIKPLLLRTISASHSRRSAEAPTPMPMRGCIIQDMGYYPFGSKFFSDLVHYVRSGDFVLNLIREAQT